MLFALRILLITSFICIIVAATGRQSGTRATLFGKWEWVSTRLQGESPLSPASTGETTTLVYKPDSTVDHYRNGVLVAAGRPFSVKRVPHPSGKGMLDLMRCPDETGFTEPYQTVWLKGAGSDTLLFVGLDPNDNFEPLVYSVFRKVKE